MIACPVCRSISVVYKAKAMEWECLDCEERFPGPIPGEPAGRTELQPSKAAFPKAIFFSYGHDQNRELVDRFKGDLEKRGHTVWVDYKEIGAWSDWRGKIAKGIHDSQLAMAFLSKHATRDPGVCRNEIAMALNRFGTVYPILLEPEQEVTPPVTITHLQWQDLSLWRQICDGLVQGKEWERWYEERLLEIISLVEGEASQFEGEISALRAVLQPATFSSDIARHVPGFVGREWVFDAYNEWLDQQPESRLFWIKAGPGVGKTAIAAMLAHEHQQAIVGAWFCQTGSIERSDPHKALHTLSFQLAARWPDYRIKLRFQLGFNASTSAQDWEGLRESLLKKNLPDLFHHLFAEPLTGLIYRDRRLVIVIDALDEATDGEGKNELTDLIAGQFSKLPPWLGFIVTSRPDPTVMSRLQGFKPFEFDAHDKRNHADLGQYLDIELGQRDDFARLPEAEQNRLKSILLEKSEGMVLYLRQIVEGLKAGALTLATLEETPRGLGGLYHNAFAHRFASNVEYERDIKPLLRLVLAAPGSLPKGLALAVLDGDKESWFRKRTRLGAYLLDTPDGLQLFHKTLREWLLDEASGVYFVDPLPAAKELGQYLWEKIEEHNAEFPLEKYRERNAKFPLEWKKQILNWLPQLAPQLPLWKEPDQLNKLGEFLRKHYALAQAETIFRHALVIQEKTSGSDHLSTATRLHKLALLLFEKGDYAAAEPFSRRALAIREKALAPDHLDTLASLNSLAMLLKATRDYVAAEPLFRRALAISDSDNAFGHEHSGPATIMHNLASLLQATGDFTAAELLCRRALALAEKVSGPEHPDTAMGLNKLALLLKNKRDYTSAEPLFRRALAILEQTLGPEHPETATCLTDLGSMLITQGDQVIQEYVLDSVRRSTIGFDNFAILLKSYGDHGAEPLFRRALAIWEKTLGSEHPETARGLAKLADVLKSKRDYASAEILCRRALSIQEKAFGPEHPCLQPALSSLSLLLKYKGDHAAAIPLCQRDLTIREKLLGSEHWGTANGLAELAELLVTQGDYAAAEPLYRHALAIREKVLEPEHPSTSSALNRLAGVLKSKGDYVSAEPLYRRVLAIVEKALGSDSTADDLDNLAEVVNSKGDYEAAEPLFRRALAIREKVCSPGHPDIVKSLNKLADFLYAQSQHEEAEALRCRAVAIQEKTPNTN